MLKVGKAWQFLGHSWGFLSLAWFRVLIISYCLIIINSECKLGSLCKVSRKSSKRHFFITVYTWWVCVSLHGVYMEFRRQLQEFVSLLSYLLGFWVFNLVTMPLTTELLLVVLWNFYVLIGPEISEAIFFSDLQSN